MLNRLIMLTLILLALSCAPTRVVKPLEKGESQVGLSFGGPLIEFSGMTIPIPLTSISYNRGISSETTLSAAFHTTSLAYTVLHSDIGVVRSLLKIEDHKIGLSSGAFGNFMLGTREGDFRFYPQLDVSAYLPLKNYNFAYAGLSSWFELSSGRAHGEETQRRLIPSIYAGINFTRPKYRYAFEIKYLQPGLSNRDIVVDYQLSGNSGALGIFLSASKRLK